MADQLSIELPSPIEAAIPEAHRHPAELAAASFADDGVEPEPPLTEDNRCLELALFWEETLLDVRHYTRPTEVTLGDGPGCDLAVPSDGLAYAPFPLLRVEEDQVVLGYGGALRGAIEHRGERHELTPPDAGGLRGAPASGEVRLPLGAVATLELDGLVLRLRHVPREAPPPSSRLREINYGWLNVLLVSLFLHTGLLGAAALYPVDVLRLDEALFQTPNRFVQLIITPRDEGPRQEGYLKLLSEAEGRSAQRHQGDEGEAGDPRAPATGKRTASKGPVESDERLVGRKVAMLFGEVGPGGVGSVLGGDLGGDLEDALGRVVGPEVGQSHGFGGLGLRGKGPGGGGDALYTYGVGQIGTHGRGTGKHGYGDGGGGLRPRPQRDIVVATGTAHICDAFDKELVRKVIRDHIDQVRYCYERELGRTPGLHGKVSVKFVIGSHGRVVNVHVAESTLASEPVEQCVVSRVRGWIFPKPKGGGVGVVTYPFVFKQGG